MRIVLSGEISHVTSRQLGGASVVLKIKSGTMEFDRGEIEQLRPKTVRQIDGNVRNPRGGK